PFLSSWINEKYKFHDTLLSSIIENALHAVAIDEIRSVFDVTPMQQKFPKPPHQTLRQIWFPGGHGCVGGGSREERGLSDAALVWMIDQVKDLGLGLEFDSSRIEHGVQPDYRIPFDNEVKGVYALTGEHLRKLVGTCDGELPQFHETVRQRWQHIFANRNQQYRPENLKDYFESHPEVLQAWSGVEQSLVQA
ncbi:MAG: phospholipase effector Tle1 domain-containing protein, partial [Elainella sp.]